MRRQEDVRAAAEQAANVTDGKVRRTAAGQEDDDHSSDGDQSPQHKTKRPRKGQGVSPGGGARRAPQHSPGISRKRPSTLSYFTADGASSASRGGLAASSAMIMSVGSENEEPESFDEAECESDPNGFGYAAILKGVKPGREVRPAID